MTEIITKQVEAREVMIKLVDGSLVKGKINLYQDEALLDRVSEVFTQKDDPFLVVFDATFEGRSGRVLIINKQNILWVAPVND